MAEPSSAAQEAKPLAKFSENLAVLERVDLQSEAVDRDKIFPIMSISKSFFGAVCALMAVDGEFGNKGVDTTLDEVLQGAERKYPSRAKEIVEYRELLRSKDFADVTVAEMLSHRSGFHDVYEEKDGVKAGAYEGRRLEFFQEQMSRREFQRGEYHYSNEGITLMEEILNLACENGYEAELQKRICGPLKLAHTGSLYRSSEALERVGEAVYLAGSTHPIRQEKLEETERFPGEKCSSFGDSPLSEGGLCSTVNDLEKYSEELVKMALGQPNSLTEKRDEMSKIYHRHELLTEGQEGYVCGLRFAKGKSGELIVYHDGGYPANNSSMRVEMDCQFDDFKDGDKQKLANAQIKQGEVSLQKSDAVADRLVGLGNDSARNFLRNYFNSK